MGYAEPITIDNVGRMAHEGMRETHKEILKIMVGQ